MNYNRKQHRSVGARVRAGLAAFALMAAVAHAYGQTSDYRFKEIDYPGSLGTYAYGINDKGEVVGWYTGAGCTQSACAFTYLKGTYTSFECVLENATQPFDVNNKGEVVGSYSYYNNGVAGFIWEGNNSCTTVPAPSASSLVEATGVNDQGVVVGYYQPPSGEIEGFRYADGKSATIACPNAADTEVWGIGNDGVIVGAYGSAIIGPWTAFTYEKGVCTNVECPSLDVTSMKAISINKSGQISGWYQDSSGVNHGFVKTGSACTQVDEPGATGTILLHMNDEGSVAGFYANSGDIFGTVAIPQQ